LQNLGIPTIIVGSGVGKTLEELIDSLYLAYDSFKVKDVEVLAVIANKVQIENIKLVTDGLKSSLPEEVLVNSIPIISSLNNPTIKEIVDELNAKVMFGADFFK
jgi:phosphate acetyltransferase